MNGLAGENSGAHLRLAASGGDIAPGYEVSEHVSHVFPPDLSAFILEEAGRLGQDFEDLINMMVDHYILERMKADDGLIGPVFLESTGEDRRSVEEGLALGITRQGQGIVPELLPEPVQSYREQ